MKISPKTEEEIAAEGLLTPGVYPFEVVKSQEKTSAKGNEMIVVDLKLFDANGEAFYVTDYLLEAFAFKLRHFCMECGLLDNYQQGRLTADDCMGRTGYAKIALERGKKKKESEECYPDKNTVKDYVGAPAAPSSAKPQPTDAQLANQTEDNESVPF